MGVWAEPYLVWDSVVVSRGAERREEGPLLWMGNLGKGRFTHDSSFFTASRYVPRPPLDDGLRLGYAVVVNAGFWWGWVVTQPEQALDSLRAIVLDIVGEPTCLSNVQCRYVPFGAKPCGGPWTYLVYSIKTTDSILLAETAADYTEREARLNRELGRVSDCRAISPPRLDCVDSRCVAAQ